ncbi:hypothetical protein I545_3940 [Mycobacterium kansasii 662]|uniref:Uncharacterized protein n=1 Tax=Mycobacterium kansasii 662 TaxID=1299326 RepID=X7ZDY3_MYCKA|nr:hypothetical protein I547_6284 [Mycobacterium kansasii 824]EUA16765.1 hypothetical protein I545_3940 [Mycobacterium kansasii 662]
MHDTYWNAVALHFVKRMSAERRSINRRRSIRSAGDIHWAAALTSGCRWIW